MMYIVVSLSLVVILRHGNLIPACRALLPYIDPLLQTHFVVAVTARRPHIVFVQTGDGPHFFQLFLLL